MTTRSQLMASTALFYAFLTKKHPPKMVIWARSYPWCSPLRHKNLVEAPRGPLVRSRSWVDGKKPVSRPGPWRASWGSTREIAYFNTVTATALDHEWRRGHRVDMTTDSRGLPVQQPPGSRTDSPRTNRTWFPILVGVQLGMVAWIILACVEPPSLYRLTVWVFNESSPKLLFAKPAYYSVHRTLLLAFAGIGGFAGIAFSNWAFTRCIVFLLGILAAIAILSTLGFHRQSIHTCWRPTWTGRRAGRLLGGCARLKESCSV